jgi:hypothetical protein
LGKEVEREQHQELLVQLTVISVYILQVKLEVEELVVVEAEAYQGFLTTQ